MPVRAHTHTHTHGRACTYIHTSNYYHPCFCHSYCSFDSVNIFIPHFIWTLSKCLGTVPFQCTDVCAVWSQRRHCTGKTQKTIIIIVLFVMFISLICKNFVWNIFQFIEYYGALPDAMLNLSLYLQSLFVSSLCSQYRN